MLSFLRDSGFEELPAEKKAAAGNGSPDRAQDVGDQDYVAVSTNTGRVRRSTTLLAVLLVAGLVCIWFMVKKTTPQGAGAATGDANTVDIERAIVHITGAKSEIFGKMDDLVGKFNEFSVIPQVKVNELVKNPFELETMLAGSNVGEGKPVVVDYQAIRRQQAQKQADKLNLLTIMKSDGKSSCMIDSSFLSEGDSVGDFTISGIESNYVKLLWNPKGEADISGGVAEKVEVILKLTE
jgi:hypothetical protein